MPDNIDDVGKICPEFVSNRVNDVVIDSDGRILLKTQNHSHAWRGTWDRPMLMDEDAMHPFTVARMTDHNVRGRDSELAKSWSPMPTNAWENEGGHL